MSPTLQKIIDDFEKQLESALYDSNYHHKKFLEAEAKIAELKESIQEIKNIQERAKKRIMATCEFSDKKEEKENNND